MKPMRHPRRTAPPRALALCVTAALLSACASLPGTITTTTYQCYGGKSFGLRYADGGSSALVTVDGRELRLPRKPSATGVLYSDGRNTFAIKGTDALLETGGVMTHYNCHSR